jgi:hypothetical protein
MHSSNLSSGYLPFANAGVAHPVRVLLVAAHKGTLTMTQIPISKG